MKMGTRDSCSAQRELAAYEHLNMIHSTHAGAALVRRLIDNVKIRSPSGEHISILHKPLAISLETFEQLNPNKNLTVPLVKSVLKYLFVTLDFLHSEANMVHTDLQARNIHFDANDDTIFRAFEENELEEPSPRKLKNEHVIYDSRGFQLPSKLGYPILCDLGEARYGKKDYSDDIQPYIYRAPEVTLQIPWTYSVDLWNVGVMTWHLIEDTPLFNAQGPDGDQLSEYHLAEMVAILGVPSLDFLRRSAKSSEYFDSDGRWKAATAISESSMEALETRMTGHYKELFLRFIRKMLRWVPEERQTAKQLLEDEWLNTKD